MPREAGGGEKCKRSAAQQPPLALCRPHPTALRKQQVLSPPGVTWEEAAGR